jgi:tetratricopeptide (TPR) repeat protein
MGDTVAQTPKIRKLRNIYIQALLEKRRTDDALEEYRKAASVAPSPAFDEQAELMIGGQLVKEKRYKEALKLYQRGLERTKMSSERLLVVVLRLIQQMRLDEGTPPSDKEFLAKHVKQYETALHHLTKKPSVLIEAAKTPLKCADYGSANVSFVVPATSSLPMSKLTNSRSN